jgi:hypothetical protein
MEDFANTNNVSIIHCDGCISLPDLIDINLDDYPKIVIQPIPGKMSKNDKLISSVSFSMKLNKNDTVSLTIYGCKVTIKLKLYEDEKITEKIKRKLNKWNVKYQIMNDRKKIDIIFSNFGNTRTLENITEKLKFYTSKYWDYCVGNIDHKITKIHITGARTETQITRTIKMFENMFKDTNVCSKLLITNFYHSMSNCSYKIGKYINLWKFTQEITTVPGFEKAFCIYNNVTDAHTMMIVLPLNIPQNIMDKLRRKNIEATFKVTNSGCITQSSPSAECGKIAYELFCNAIKELGPGIFR